MALKKPLQKAPPQRRQAQPPPEEKRVARSSALAVHGNTAVATANMQKRLAQYSGAGTSTDAADNLVPIMKILQALSPECQKRQPSYVEGAEPGLIFLKNTAEPLADGETGVIFQSCHFYKKWVEWIPRENGGGMAGQYDELPDDVEQQRDLKSPNNIQYIRPNGNEVIETRYHPGYLYQGFRWVEEPSGEDPGSYEYDSAIPFVVSFSRTGHTVSRGWMFNMNNQVYPKHYGGVAGQKAASFAQLYRLTTKERTNASGTWFVFEPNLEGWVTQPEDLDRGITLYEAFAKGDKQAEAPEAEHREDGEGAAL